MSTRFRMARPIAVDDVPDAATSRGASGGTTDIPRSDAADAPNPLIHRSFALIIAVAAAFVAWLGFFEPERMDRAFTWASLPPLHAGFVGSLYLFGAVLVAGSGLVPHRAEWGGAIGGIAIFTTSMLVLTVLNTEAFDWSLGPVRVWVISYVVYPPIAWALTIWLSRRPITSAGGREVAPPTTLLLRFVTVAFALVGTGLVTARTVMADLWPWPVSEGVAQFYGGPFLAVAWVSWWYSTRRNRSDLVVYAPSIVVLAVSVVAVSLQHRALFAADLASFVWFAGFGGLGAGHLVVTVDSWRHRHAS